MQALRITEHSKAGWSTYAQEIGFVPDPMILRTGEIFLNGAKGVGRLERRDFDVWRAVKENVGGLLDFFDMVVSRDTIPLINYNDTFDQRTILAPLDERQRFFSPVLFSAALHKPAHRYITSSRKGRASSLR
jgi:hypothetical protein